MEDSLFHYKKLLSLLEEDYECMNKGIQGDMLEAYHNTVRLEIEELIDIIKEFRIFSEIL